MEIEDLISIGFIKRPFGNDGFVTVVPKSIFNEAFSIFSELFLVWGDGKVRYKTVETISESDNTFKLKFSHINNKNDAYKLKNAKVMIAKEDLKQLRQYQPDLPKDFTGYKIITTKNKSYGNVREILITKAHPILVVEDEVKNEILIPYVDKFIKKIDDKNRVILLETIPGLIDAN